MAALADVLADVLKELINVVTQCNNSPRSVAQSYVGRFAPSPTGKLHFGSLLAAVASRLQALTAGGLWHVRIDDLDGPRCDPTYAASILKTLSAYGCDWHGEVVYQSQRRERYAAAMQALIANNGRNAAAVYRCDCGRRQLNQTAPRGDSGLIYPGHCRGRPAGSLTGDYAQRIQVPGEPIEFIDGWQGRITRDLASEDGDFVVWRRDHLPAYHLAVVVDDTDLGVTESVRGIDLLLTAPRQIFLQHQLGLPTPHYRHLPIAVTRGGGKISKMTRAPALPLDEPARLLHAALTTLRQEPPAALAKESVATLWQWAIGHWQPEQLYGLQQLPINDESLTGENQR